MDSLVLVEGVRVERNPGDEAQRMNPRPSRPARIR
jgi:hypothetical protein